MKTITSTQSRHAVEGFHRFAQGRAREAIDSFLAGLRENRADLHCMLGLGRIAMATGDDRNARELFSVLAALAPDCTEARSHLALLALREGRSGALDELRALAERPTAGWLELLNFATAAREAGEPSSAASALHRAAALRPDDPVVLSQLGTLALERGDGRSAQQHLSRACELAPREWALRVLLARAWWSQGAVAEALRELSATLEAHPRARAVAEELFTIALAAGNPGLAERAAVHLRAERDDADARYRHALALLAAGRLAEAKKLFEGALEAAPKAPEPRHALASVVALLGEPARAEKLLEEALELAPAQPALTNELAVLLLARGDAPRAEAVLRQAWRAEAPDDGVALNLALATAKQNKPGEAKKFALVARGSPRADVRDQAERLMQALG